MSLAASSAEILEQMALGRPAPVWLDALRIERLN